MDAQNPCETNLKPSAEGKQKWIPWAVQNLKAKYEQRKSAKQQETSENRSSRRTALATVWIAAFTFVLASVGIFQGSVAQRTLDELQSEQRPWISAPDIRLIGNIVHDDNGLQLTAQFTLKNTGKSPAKKVFVSFKPSFSGWGPEATRAVCTEAENSMFGLSIFPEDVVTQSIGGTIGEVEFKKLKENSIDVIIPAVGACVAYQDMGGKFHYTPYNFAIYSVVSGKSPIRVLLARGSIQPSSINLGFMPIGINPD